MLEWSGQHCADLLTLSNVFAIKKRVFWLKFCITDVCSFINSLRPSDPIWRHKSGSTLTQVMACCLTAPSHYMNQVDLSSVRSSGIHHDFPLLGFCGIHMRTISHWMPPLLFSIMSLKIMILTFLPHTPGVNELRACDTYFAGPLTMTILILCSDHWSLECFIEIRPTESS